jgi:hypothetical protein
MKKVSHNFFISSRSHLSALWSMKKLNALSKIRVSEERDPRHIIQKVK